MGCCKIYDPPKYEDDPWTEFYGKLKDKVSDAVDRGSSFLQTESTKVTRKKKKTNITETVLHCCEHAIENCCMGTFSGDDDSLSLSDLEEEFSELQQDSTAQPSPQLVLTPWGATYKGQNYVPV